jgi:shikimate kinase
LSRVENHIIATGGGIILKQENIDIMKKIGLIVFLDINLQAQLKRVKYRKHRPLLKNTDLEKKLKDLKSERDPIYNTISDYIIDVSGKDKNTVVEEIKNKIV